MARILIVEDNPDVRLTLWKMLEKEEFGEMEMAEDGVEALEKLSADHFDLCLLDLGLPRLRGEEVLRHLREKNIRTEVVVLTGEGTMENAVEVTKLGAREFVQKGSSSAELLAVIRPLLEQYDQDPASLARRLDAYLRDHYTQADLRPGALCRQFRISHAYLCRLFQEYFGTTCQKRLTLYRIQKARELLRTTDLPLYLVSDQCGFRNYARLNRAFRLMEGMSAGEFRRTDSV
jgi:YesN/AraC family two-component response regulator